MVKAGIIAVSFLLILTLSAPCIFAQEANWQTKLGNGSRNLLLGWLEIPKQIKEVTMEADPIAGITYGTARGIAFTLARGLVGVFDIVTCPFPPYDEPMIEPEITF